MRPQTKICGLNLIKLRRAKFDSARRFDLRRFCEIILSRAFKFNLAR
ncbi:MAG: hypothetical protein ACFNUU_08550 [Campylobacter sp.]